MTYTGRVHDIRNVIAFFCAAIQNGICYTDTDLSSASLADIAVDQNQQSVTSLSSTVLDISVDLGPVDVTLCTANESNYLCFYVRHQNETASFRDDVTDNNVQCMDMAVNKVCHPGKTIIKRCF